MELFNWRGVFGAPGLTPEKQAALVGLIEKMVRSPAWQAELAARRLVGDLSAGRRVRKYLESEIARITAILKDLGLAT